MLIYPWLPVIFPAESKDGRVSQFPLAFHFISELKALNSCIPSSLTTRALFRKTLAPAVPLGVVPGFIWKPGVGVEVGIGVGVGVMVGAGVEVDVGNGVGVFSGVGVIVGVAVTITEIGISINFSTITVCSIIFSSTFSTITVLTISIGSVIGKAVTVCST